MFIKTFMRKELAQYAVDNMVTSHWTNPHTQESQPQVTIDVDGEVYWLDIWPETGELISVHSQKLLDETDKDSDMGDLLSKANYINLCVKIESEIFKKKKAAEDKALMSDQSQMLFDLVNNINKAYLAGAKHA